MANGFLTVVLIAGMVAVTLYAFGSGSLSDIFGSSPQDPFTDPAGNPIGTQLYLTSNSLIPADVDTWVAWEAVNFDHGGYADLGLDPYNLTVPDTGSYFVTAQIRWEGYEPLSRTTTIMVNGAFNSESQCTAPANAFFCTQSVTLSLTTGDDIAVRVGQDSDKALDIISGATSSRFSVIPQ